MQHRKHGILLLVFATLGASYLAHANPAEEIGGSSPPAKAPLIRDLAAASVLAASAGVTVWNSHTELQTKAEGRVTVVPPSTLVPGRFAAARFRGQQLSWTGFDTLVLDVVCGGTGQVAIVLAEHDDGKRENFAVRLETLDPGRHQLRFRLAPAPQGDLKPSGLTRDGAWNPDAETGVHMILADYPRGFVIEGMRLEQSAPDEEGAAE